MQNFIGALIFGALAFVGGVGVGQWDGAQRMDERDAQWQQIIDERDAQWKRQIEDHDQWWVDTATDVCMSELIRAGVFE